MAELRSLQHQILIDPKIGDWILQAKQENLSSSWQQANLQWMEYEYLQASCLPTDLVQKSTETFMRTEHAWRILRAENNWHDFLPLLTENINLIKEKAQIKAETFAMDPYDCLINEFSPGLSQAIIDPIFIQLKNFLPDFLQTVIAKQKKHNAVIDISGTFPIDQQRLIAKELMQAIGFDFKHGRLDESHHPFCGGVSEDVRITTRYNENDFLTGMMAICHETGHGLYEQNLPKEWNDQPVGQALGMAIHESQSLLIEMQVCRSREFMDFLAKLIPKYFGANTAFSPENLYQHHIKVTPGYIRVDADELCYPLHIILRYELEKKLISGEAKVSDLPELWNEEMKQFLGLSTENNYRDGVMQDVHWSAGLMGYFPAYTMGAIIAAQLFQSFKMQNPNFHNELKQGNFKALTLWLSQKIHKHGRKFIPDELLIKATGQALSVDPFVHHLQQRYLESVVA